MIYKIKRICCIGAGYVGGPTMAVIADKCKKIQVNVVDISKERINAWNDDNFQKLPIYEPGLMELVKRRRGKNLFFSTEIEANISKADMVFLSVNTPTKEYGIGSGEASDLKWIEKCARQVAFSASGHTIVVEKSTLPVKTAETIKIILNSVRNNLSDNSTKTFSVLSNPEFLAEGTAIKDLTNPDRVLIGGDDEVSIDCLAKIYEEWVDPQKIIKTNLWSSELSKLTANAFLAQRISSINSVAAICEVTGANIKEVSLAIGRDKRIGKYFLNAGPGFGGSCFKKDILNLVYLSKHFGLPEIARYWESVVSLNMWNQDRISEIIVDKLFGTLADKKIAILGFSFKSNTNDTRESSAIRVAKNLLKEGAYLLIHDPKVSEKQIEIDLEDKDNLQINHNLKKQGLRKWEKVSDVYEASDGVDAIVVLTEWDEYSKLKWDLIAEKMRYPAWVFDTRLVINEEKIKFTKINFWRIGIG